ncbi:CBD9-like protein [Xylaria nigripes]|nr:CBD9-like protein [Xylaria nigripes]
MARLLPFLCLLLGLAFAKRSYAALDQVCHLDEVRGVDICLVLSCLADNASSSYHLAFSGKFDRNLGWAAFGRGHAMDAALMFLFYPNAELDGLTVGVRTTSGHYPPHLSSLQPQVSVIKTSVTDDGYYTAEVICYGCREDSVTQGNDMREAWIWSANTDQKMQTNDVEAVLQMHADYGEFYIIYSRDHTNNSKGRFDIRVQDDAVLQGLPLTAGENRTSNFGPESESTKSTSFWISVHGALMLCAFLIIYPLGIVAMALGYSNAFWTHVSAQTLGTTCVFIAAILKLMASAGFRKSRIHSYTSALGLAIVVGLVVQVILGVHHHRIFMKSREPTNYSKYHKLLGRVISGCGVLNGLLACYIFNDINFVFAVILFVILLFLVSWMVFWRYKTKTKTSDRHKVRYQHPHEQDEEMEEFLSEPSNRSDA